MKNLIVALIGKMKSIIASIRKNAEEALSLAERHRKGQVPALCTRRGYRGSYLLCITSVSRTHHDFVGILACSRSFHLYRSGLRRLERLYS